jgi:hypothetical protein
VNKHDDMQVFLYIEGTRVQSALQITLALVDGLKIAQDSQMAVRSRTLGNKMYILFQLRSEIINFFNKLLRVNYIKINLICVKIGFN